MSGGGPSGAPGDAAARDHPDVLSVCRWLPQPFPAGAFSGRHDLVHVGDRQGYVNLWLTGSPVHDGDYVGPPRGGLVPGQEADYDVAMPAGGWLQIRGGILRSWADSPGGPDQIRADGEQYLAQSYGPAWPYRISHYRAMTRDDRLNALAAVRRRRLSMDGSAQAAAADAAPSPERLAQAAAIADWVASSRDPRTCTCQVQPQRRSAGGRSAVPGALLVHGGAIATMVGNATPDEACEVVWRLTRALTHPTRAGLMRAAETAARRSAEPVSGMPDGPLTEDAVAVVAAQALRWHGRAVADRLPFWTLGWIFIAGPVLDGLLPDSGHSGRERMRRALLDRADRERMRRVAHAWNAAHAATRELDQLQQLAGEDVVRSAAVIDLREPGAAAAAIDPDEYRRSVSSVIAELAAQ